MAIEIEERMKFFLDSADIDEIREVEDTGLLNGVTTNPSLIANSGRDYEKVLREICSITEGPVSAEVTAVKAKDMFKEAWKLKSISENIVIKLPSTKEGIKVCNELTQHEIKTNLTLCFSPAQAILAAKAGATYVSPFIGRVDDISMNGINLISQIVEIYNNYGFETQILAASIRSPEHVTQAALVGVDVVTLPFKVFNMLFDHPLTDIGIEKFMSDWKNSGQKLAK